MGHLSAALTGQLQASHLTHSKMAMIAGVYDVCTDVGRVGEWLFSNCVNFDI